MIAPTTACDAETGSPERFIHETASPAVSATVNDPAIAFTAPSAPSVSVPPPPLITAPSITPALAMNAANRKLSIRLPTAVPKMFAASLAPSDQPRKSPLSRKNQIIVPRPRQTTRLIAAMASRSHTSSASSAMSSVWATKERSWLL